MSKEVLHINELELITDSKTLISGFSLMVEQGEKITVSGESGSGKTTLLNSILGFYPIESGGIKLLGKELNQENVGFFRQNISWLPQQLNFKTTVKEHIDLIFNFNQNKSIKPSNGEFEALGEILGLEKDIIDRKFTDISGGEKQRVGICLSVLLKRPLMILDEPVASLDEKSKGLVTDFLLNNKELTILSTSHDPFWSGRCTKIIDLK